MNPHQIVTTHLVEEVPAENGYFKPDGVYNKICVVERHGKTGEIGVAPLKGFGVKGGAVATSVAHDSHNLIVAGDNDEDILAAIKGVEENQGGYVIASGGKVVDVLPLPICGLMSENPVMRSRKSGGHVGGSKETWHFRGHRSIYHAFLYGTYGNTGDPCDRARRVSVWREIVRQL